MAEVREHLLRCAIYTRKSTEEGLEQSFHTLQAQREAAEAYILSHREEGWRTVPALYDDGGWSGANLERPALKRLLADIEARRGCKTFCVNGVFRKDKENARWQRRAS